MRVGLVLGAALLAGAAPVGAATLTARFEGTVFDGFDTTGVFGTAGTSLSGASYVATFVYDTSLGSRDNEGGRDFVGGGAEFDGGPDPIVLASLTLKGVTLSATGFSRGSVGTDAGGVFAAEAVDNDFDGVGVDGSTNLFLAVQDADVPASLEVAFEIDAPDQVMPILGDPFFSFFRVDAATGETLALASAALSVARVKVTAGGSEPAPIPLPAGGPLLLAVLGGAALVRRRT